MPSGGVVGGDGDGFVVDDYSISEFCGSIEEFDDATGVDDVDVVGLFYLVVHPDFDDVPVASEVVFKWVWYRVVWCGASSEKDEEEY